MRIAERNEPPRVVVPADRTAREGEPIRFVIRASAASDRPLTFSSPVLPFGATLDPSTGEFLWTPTYIQEGVYEIPFAVSDGETAVPFLTTIQLLPANAAPGFDTPRGHGKTSQRENVCQYGIRISDWSSDVCASDLSRSASSSAQARRAIGR